MMPSLLMLAGGKWSRHELPAPAGYAALKTSGVPLVTVGEGRLVGRPEDVVGVIVLCAGQPYYVAAAGSATYLNAQPRPAMPLHRLRDRDRLTYHAADGSTVRVWYLQDGEARQRYDGSPGQVVCGYCSAGLAPGEEFATCPGCAETVHADCLEHGANKCPRCGMVVLPDAEPWVPDGFPPEESEDDHDWN